MVHDLHTPQTMRTLLHGLGAGALTLLAFGLGPALGLGAARLPQVEVLEGPVEGAPQGTFAFVDLELDGPEVDGPEVDEAVVAEQEAPTSAEEPRDEAVEEIVERPVAEEPEVARVEDVRAAPEPDPVEAETVDEKSILEHAVAGTRPTSRPKGRRCESDRSNPKIERSSRGSFVVEKDLITWYITHLGALNSLGWSSKHEGPDGRSDGMRIGGVKCGNDLHLAGIRSGDVVHRVNGHDVRSIPQAIMVYRKVRKDHRIRVELTRRGKPVTLTYRLS